MQVLQILVICGSALCMGMEIWYYKSKKFRTTLDFLILLLILILGIVVICKVTIEYKNGIEERTDKLCYEKYHYDPVSVEVIDDLQETLYRKTDVEVLSE